MTVSERVRSKAGHGWRISIVRWKYFPTFWSRFRLIRKWYSVRLSDFHELKMHYDREENLGYRSDCDVKMHFKSLHLRDRGPEVKRWLSENAIGRVDVRVAHDHGLDPLIMTTGYEDKSFEAHFENEGDATKFKLALL